MEISLQNLIIGLNQRDRPGMDVPFLQYGAVAVDALLDAANSKGSSANQVANCIYVLFSLAREHDPAWFNKLVPLILEFMKSDSEVIRSSSAISLVRLSVLAKRFPQLKIGLPVNDAVIEMLKSVVEKGVRKDTKEYIEAFLEAE
jgi:hypothetical protein